MDFNFLAYVLYVLFGCNLAVVAICIWDIIIINVIIISIDIWLLTCLQIPMMRAALILGALSVIGFIFMLPGAPIS